MNTQEVAEQRCAVGELCCQPVLQAELGTFEAGVLASALRALADPTRLRLLSLIRLAPEGRAMTHVLAESVGLTQPTVTHHLGSLYEAGLVHRERDGRQTWYSVNSDGLQAIRQMLDPAKADAG